MRPDSAIAFCAGNGGGYSADGSRLCFHRGGLNIRPDLGSIQTPQAEANWLLLLQLSRHKQLAGRFHVAGKDEIEAGHFCYFFEIDSHKVAKIRSRK